MTSHHKVTTFLCFWLDNCVPLANMCTFIGVVGQIILKASVTDMLTTEVEDVNISDILWNVVLALTTGI